MKISQPLDTTISSLTIADSVLELNDQLINEKVFMNTKHFHIKNSILNAIQEDLFKNFARILTLDIELLNFGKFINLTRHQNWLKNVQFVDNESVSPKRIILTDLNFDYNYPDYDFCYFVDFPHANNVIPVSK
jgi:hypothetical protein